jgi:hypothetical protein
VGVGITQWTVACQLETDEELLRRIPALWCLSIPQTGLDAHSCASSWLKGHDKEFTGTSMFLWSLGNHAAFLLDSAAHGLPTNRMFLADENCTFAKHQLHFWRRCDDEACCNCFLMISRPLHSNGEDCSPHNVRPFQKMHHANMTPRSSVHALELSR